MNGKRHCAIAAVLLGTVLFLLPAWAEDGYSLWLRYQPVGEQGMLRQYRAAAAEIVLPEESELLQSAASELEQGLAGLLGRRPPRSATPSRPGGLVLGTAGCRFVRGNVSEAELRALGPGGYLIRSRKLGGLPVTIIAGNTGNGVL